MIRINTPAFIHARDYHDFDIYNAAYAAIGLDVEVSELGFKDGYYQAIVHSQDASELAYVEMIQEAYDILFSD